MYLQFLNISLNYLSLCLKHLIFPINLENKTLFIYHLMTSYDYFIFTFNIIEINKQINQIHLFK